MLPGLGRINPAQMKAMMNQLGIKSENLNVSKVVFELDDKKLVIESPNVTAMTVQGQQMYQVIGAAKEELKALPEEDINMVVEQTGVSKEKAQKALEKSQGDIAEAITKLKELK